MVNLRCRAAASGYFTRTVEFLMRISLNVVAVLLIVIGVIWILQGVGILPGSFMTGEMQWAYRGAVALVVGIIIGVVANRRKR